MGIAPEPGYLTGGHAALADLYQDTWRPAWRPPPRLSVSEWANRFRYLSPEASAEPGLWSNSRAPHLIEPMDRMSPTSATERVVLKFSSQSGKSECLLNFIGFIVDLDPGPILAIQPNVTPMGEAFSKDRVKPMLRDSPSLAAKIGTAKGRTSAQTITHMALDVDTPVPTPEGWKRMGDMEVGDVVFDENGAQCSVTYVTPIVYDRPCYSVKFHDGSEIIADEDHPWFVEWRNGSVGTGKRQSGIKTTKEMTVDLRSGNRWRYAVPVAGPLQCEEKELPIDPYILGAWLGDGFSHSAMMVAGKDDYEMCDIIKKILPDMREPKLRRLWHIFFDPLPGKGPTCNRGHRGNNKTADGHCRVCHAQHERFRKTGKPVDPQIDHTIRRKMQRINLLSKAGDGKSRKIIPAIYLRSSVAQRMALLQGLMDTDGNISKRDFYARFVNKSKTIINGITELLHSLGFSVGVDKTEAPESYKNNIPSYAVRFSPKKESIFRLTRKKEIQELRKNISIRSSRRRIVAIDPVPSVPVRCIAVDSSSHLYLAGESCIPTHNTFPSGHLTIAGANSPAGLASRPIRYLLCDELDRWEVTKEGDPLLLARKRLQTFRARRTAKELIVSSPTYDDLGICAEYARCNQQWEWHLSCLHCGTTQFPKLEHFLFEADPRQLRYVCKSCGAAHSLEDADAVKATGQWVCVKDGSEESIGYWFNQFASPFARWDDTLAEWLEAGTDPARRQAVTNTVFAEPWEGEGEKIEPSLLSQRAEDWGETIPSRVIAITMGADVQGDRLEVETIGWGPTNESWSLAYDVLPGEPTSDEVWDDLLDLYRQSWPRADGSTLRPVALCVDAGYATQHVYSFVKRARERGIVPIKGVAGMARDQITGDRRQRLKRIAQRMRDGRPPEILGVDSIKRTIFHYLSAAPGNTGYCHFPHGRSEEYYLQLTGERLMVINQRGKRPERRWVPIHPAVEALDCRVYAYAALLLSGLELRAPQAPRSAPEEKAIEAPASVAPPPPVAAERVPAVSRPGRSGRRNFATSWR